MVIVQRVALSSLLGPLEGPFLYERCLLPTSQMVLYHRATRLLESRENNKIAHKAAASRPYFCTRARKGRRECNAAAPANRITGPEPARFCQSTRAAGDAAATDACRGGDRPQPPTQPPVAARAWIGINDMACVHQRPSTRNHHIHHRRSNTYPAQVWRAVLEHVGGSDAAAATISLERHAAMTSSDASAAATAASSPLHIHSSQFRATGGIALSANARGPVDRPRQTRGLLCACWRQTAQEQASSRLRQV